MRIESCTRGGHGFGSRAESGSDGTILDRYGPAMGRGRGRAHQLVEYDIELEATFIETVHTTLACPGLTREELEELIDDNWSWISAETEVLLESHWELERFSQIGHTSVTWADVMTRPTWTASRCG